MSRLAIQVIALTDCNAMVPVGFADMLRKSEALSHEASPRRYMRHIDVSLVSATRARTVRCAGGIQLQCDETLNTAPTADLILVPALDPDVLEHLRLNQAVAPWLSEMYTKGADVASACTGAFLVAEAGLLQGKAATTHWAYQDLFKDRYANVRLEREAVIVDQGRVITAGGATSFLNLALYLVEKFLGADLARAASKMFLIDLNKAPQQAYAIFAGQKGHGDEQVLRAQGIIEKHLSDIPPIADLALQVAMSKRNFVRRFVAATGNTPQRYVQRVRVEAAKRALENGATSIGSLASEVGYSDVVAFRRIFSRITGLTPADYRKRYGSG